MLLESWLHSMQGLVEQRAPMAHRIRQVKYTLL